MGDENDAAADDYGAKLVREELIGAKRTALLNAVAILREEAVRTRLWSIDHPSTDEGAKAVLEAWEALIDRLEMNAEAEPSVPGPDTPYGMEHVYDRNPLAYGRRSSLAHGRRRPR